jgi:sarcosine oxidase subunit alpha
MGGFAGDSLASALLANGVRVVGRSFKFHRPRGVFSAGIEEPHALVQIGSGARTVPSARATLAPLCEGLDARSQAGWPNVSFDALRALDFAAPLFAAGFYNKTFMWPSWHAYEPLIRRLAGLGRAPIEPDPDRYEVRNAHCDVLIVGGGVSGIRAALEAARARQRVILIDQDEHPGGQSRWDGSRIDGLSAVLWLERSLNELQRAPDVQVMPRTMAVGCYDHRIVTLLESGKAGATARERFWIVRTARLVLATGAIEQPLVFCNNDRPGVMLAGAARRYLGCHAIAPGRRTVIATNNDSAYALALELRHAGIAPLAVLDSRSRVPAEHRAQMLALSIPLHIGCMPVDTRGFGALSSVSFRRVAPDGTGEPTYRLACDALLVSGGWNPALHLFAQAGGKLRYDDASGALEPANSLGWVDIVGDAASNPDAAPIGPRVSTTGSTARQWLDLLHDVTVSDIELALRENFASTEHVKRFTTVGMAADQGKTSAPASLEIIAHLRGCSAADLGHTTLRPPLMPVTLGAIAGRAVGERFAPSRLLPMHDWHVANGAKFEDFGEWKRPAVYLKRGESRVEGIMREARAVRSAAGLFDGSPLGKIEIHGPDALEFLDRFYINDLTTLKPHRARYGLMLRESGILFDDGTVVMLASDRFLITTTSGNAGRVGQWLEEWHQCEWPQLRVAIMPVTEQWATVSLAGPQARAILSRLPSDLDLSAAAFPHLAMRERHLLGIPARIYRVSFTGELTYEINVPRDRGQALWDALLSVGAEEGLQPFGMDALLLMRLEKGFLHVGSDTDGTTVPDDVGWGKVAANKKRDYIGKRSLTLPEHLKSDRLQLVGLSAEAGQSFIIGSHLRLNDSNNTTDGWITSAGTTVLTGDPIALAMLRGGRSRIGTEVDVYDLGARTMRARVVSPPFFDSSGDRMNG